MKMLTPFEFDLPARRTSRAKNLLTSMLISQLLTTGLGATVTGDMMPLQQQTLAQGVKTFVPPNYALSFNITPTGLVSGWSSIIHYTQDISEWGPKGRTPSLYFEPNSTILRGFFSTTFSSSEFFYLPLSLPLNSQTRVRIETVEKDVAVFYNDSIVHITTLTGIRYSGNVTVFTSSPWGPASLARISKMNMTSISSITGSNRSLADFNGPISKGAVIGKTFVPADYALTFDITPTGLVSSWSNIIHYTQDMSEWGPKGRTPSLYFEPNSTILRGFFSTTFSSVEEFFLSVSLPLNCKTSVRIEAVDKEVAIFYNNSIVHITTLTGIRYSGKVTVLISSPWGPASLARISKMNMTSISSITGSDRSLADFNGPISKGAVIGKTFVPADYALSFDITPTGLVSKDASIIHYTPDNSNWGPKGCMPTFYFNSNSTVLKGFVSTTSSGAEGYYGGSSLPLNSKTSVRFEAVGQYLMLFLNNTLDRMMAVNGTRFYGNASVLLSDPWYPSAAGSISSIRMSSLISSKITNPDSEILGEIPRALLIYNSLFDDCSREAGADAGCGLNLQCNTFYDGKSSCEPVKNSLVKLLHSIDESDVDSIIISRRHQTCGISSRYRNTCSQTTDDGILTCSEVSAIVKGQDSTKWICLNDNDVNSRLEKRIVRRRFWYSDGDADESYGQNYKAI